MHLMSNFPAIFYAERNNPEAYPYISTSREDYILLFLKRTEYFLQAVFSFISVETASQRK